MKRFYVFAFSLVCFMGFSFAGVPGKNPGELLNKNRVKAGELFRLPLNPSDVRYNWDTALLYDTAGPAEKFTRVFNNNGSELSELNYVMDAGNWVVFSRVRITYDDQGNQIVRDNDHWVNGAWVFFTRSEMTYDASGNLLETVIQSWLSGAWQNSYKFYSSYDAGGNVISEGDASWSDGAWVNETRNTYTLDAQGKALTSLYEVWKNGAWLAHGFETNTYDVSGILLITVGQIWKGGAWVNSDKASLSYNAASQLLTELKETWDTLHQQWMNWFKYSSSYDVSGNLLTLLTESWDKAGNGWVNLKRNRFAYDASGNSTNGNCEEWKAGAWGPGMSSISVYSQQKLVYTFWWPLHYQYQATFTSYSSGVDEIDNSMALSVFPNPAGEKLTIVCKNLKPGQQVAIYDLQGRLILQSSITRSNYELDISRLSPGNFLIRMGSGTEAGCAHFIKK